MSWELDYCQRALCHRAIHWTSFPDIAVVAANGAQPISYNRATGSCALVCHGEAHGGVTGIIKKNSKR